MHSHLLGLVDSHTRLDYPDLNKHRIHQLDSLHYIRLDSRNIHPRYFHYIRNLEDYQNNQAQDCLPNLLVNYLNNMFPLFLDFLVHHYQYLHNKHLVQAHHNRNQGQRNLLLTLYYLQHNIRNYLQKHGHLIPDYNHKKHLILA